MRKFIKNNWIFILIAVIVVLGADYFLNFSTLNISGNFSNENVEKVEGTEDTEKQEENTEKNVIENDEIKLTVIDMWLEDALHHDGKAVAFEYEFINKTDSPIFNDITSIPVIINVIQDNNPDTINKLSIEGTKFYRLDGLTEVKPNGKSIFGEGFLLTDETTPITITAEEFLGDEFYRETFEITNLELR